MTRSCGISAIGPLADAGQPPPEGLTSTTAPAGSMPGIRGRPTVRSDEREDQVQKPAAPTWHRPPPEAGSCASRSRSYTYAACARNPPGPAPPGTTRPPCTQSDSGFVGLS